MDRHDIVVMGSSAGGVETLMRICGGLPADLPASVFLVQHMSPSSRSMLPELLSRVGKLPARHPQDGEATRAGHIYVAPPDHHMLLEPGRVLLRRGPHENRTRPAVDPLFRSAAVSYGARVIGVVLTGLLDDGTAGLVAIKRCGGVSVVQDPLDATWPEMPRNALEGDHVDYTTTAADLPSLLTELTRQDAGPTPPISPNLAREARIAAEETRMANPTGPLGHPSRLSCPQCGGVLNEVQEEGAARFRCQIGHAFSPESLLAAQSEELERALEVAVRTHRERVVLFRRMEQLSLSRALPHAAAHWSAAAAEAEGLAHVITQAITKLKKPVLVD